MRWEFGLVTEKFLQHFLQNIKKAVSLQRFWRKVLQPEYKIGRLAQLVQSICLTSRGSGVRIPQRPLNLGRTLICSTFFNAIK